MHYIKPAAALNESIREKSSDKVWDGCDENIDLSLEKIGS